MWRSAPECSKMLFSIVLSSFCSGVVKAAADNAVPAKLKLHVNLGLLIVRRKEHHEPFLPGRNVKVDPLNLSAFLEFFYEVLPRAVLGKSSAVSRIGHA